MLAERRLGALPRGRFRAAAKPGRGMTDPPSRRCRRSRGPGANSCGRFLMAFETRLIWSGRGITSGKRTLPGGRRWRPKSFRKLLSSGQHRIIARTAIAIESRTNLLFSFEKMALRDAVATNDGARIFADGLFGFLHGEDIPILQRVADPSPASRDFRNHRGIVFKGPPMGSSVFCEPASCRANRPAIAAVVARLPIQHDD